MSARKKAAKKRKVKAPSAEEFDIPPLFKKFLTEFDHWQSKQRINADLSMFYTDAVLGDSNAAELLSQIALEATHALAQLGKIRPDLISTIAPKFAYWPLLCGPYPAIESRNKQFLTKFKVGAEAKELFDMKALHRTDTTGRRWVVDAVMEIQRVRDSYDKLVSRGKSLPQFIESNLPKGVTVQKVTEQGEAERLDILAEIIRIQERVNTELAEFAKVPFFVECLHLPPFDKTTIKQWYRVVRRRILTITNGRPEDVPELKWIAKRGIKKAGVARRKESYMRAEIFEEIMKALKQLAPR